MVLQFVQALPYWLFSFVLSSVLLLPPFSFVLGGAADLGKRRKGCPGLTPSELGTGRVDCRKMAAVREGSGLEN